MIDTNSLINELRETRPEFEEAIAVVELVRNVGDTLQRMRERKGLSQADVAKKLDVSAGRVSQLESGTVRNAPNLKTLVQFAKACGETIEVRLLSELASQSKSENLSGKSLQMILAAIASLSSEVRELRAIVASIQVSGTTLPKYPKVRPVGWQGVDPIVEAAQGWVGVDAFAIGDAQKEPERTLYYGYMQGDVINVRTLEGVEQATKSVLRAVGSDYVAVNAEKRGSDDQIELKITFAQQDNR